MAENSNIVENFIRSAKAPAISAGVMMAKVNWNIMKIVSGIVLPERMVSAPIPFKKALPIPPTKEFKFVVFSTIPAVSKAKL